jgi:hypothetical protein
VEFHSVYQAKSFAGRSSFPRVFHTESFGFAAWTAFLRAILVNEATADDLVGAFGLAPGLIHEFVDLHHENGDYTPSSQDGARNYNGTANDLVL